MSFLRGLVFSLAIVVLGTLALAAGRWSGFITDPSPDRPDSEQAGEVGCAPVSARSVSALNEEVVNLYSRGDGDCAYELAVRALDDARANLDSNDPAHIDALNNLARLESDSDNWEQAAALYQEVVDNYVDNDMDYEDAEQARFRLAAALGQSGQPQEADRIYAEIRDRRAETEAPAAPQPESSEPPISAQKRTTRGAGQAGDSGHSEIDVFYGTDRAPSVDDGIVQYTSDQDGELHLGVATVTIPASHTYGGLESPSIWRLEFRPNPDRHVILKSVDPLDENTFQSALERYMDRADSREAFVFVHGYNVTFEDAARRTAQMAYDMQFPGAPIFYSWPSRGQLLSYARDETMVQRTVPYLSEFLTMIARETGAETVHLIAHSMGNRAMTNALKILHQESDEIDGPLFNEILLAAPDIDVEVFRQISDAVIGMGAGTTLYASANDKALGASRRLRKDLTRLGDTRDGVTVIRNMESVDASLVSSDFLGHGYFADSRTVLGDIDLLIDTGLRAEERGLRPQQNSAGQTYWRVQPCGETALVC